jgi:pyruvate/2-oxoglutarate dehydrogenase complex dihydrolipoamide acyltransferase (E2) component
MRYERILKVPALGGDRIVVAEWKASVGDRVTPSSELLILETDKVTYSMEADAEGVLKEIRVPQGLEVHEGDILGILEVEEPDYD